jgi:translation initiation factor IF-3
VRVIDVDGQQAGVMTLQEALAKARVNGVDLVEVAPNATPPVCRLVDYGKYRYELAKREKEAKKHQHANKVKEIQLSPKIDPHDMGVKLAHAIDFLCEEMKVKVTLRFRGREMAHKEFGFRQIERFTQQVAPFGHPDNQARVVGRGITVMFSPLPRNKRARNPRDTAEPGSHPPRSHEHKEAVLNGEGDAFDENSEPSELPGSSEAKPPINVFPKLDLNSQPPAEAAGGS